MSRFIKPARGRFQLIPFRAEHYLALAPRPEEAAIRDYKPLLVERLVQSACSATLTDWDRPIVCGGMFLLWTGVGEYWFHGTWEAAQHPVPVFRNAKRLVDTWARLHRLHRLQVTVEEQFAVSVRFVEALGFTLEGRMERYGPNQETFLRFVRLP